MCGIAGIIFKNEISPDWADSVMNKMLNSIAHRGPDGRNTFKDEGVILGHVRLSIIDIKTGDQPMYSNDGSLIIVFNGEIYNYIELRQMLIKKGYDFRTNSDTEVLINLFKEFGEKMLDHLNGMFAFVIYDKIKRIAFAARDHFGIKPLYFIQTDRYFAFASEIKALFNIPDLKPIAQLESLHEYITFQFTLSENTMFQNIIKLQPAHSLVIYKGEMNSPKKYWELDYKIDESKTIDQFSDELLVLLNNSISIQMRSDVPVGVYLSGGIDSSIIAMLSSKHSSDAIQCFTGAFKDSLEYDETMYAQIVSKQINAEQKVVYPEWKDFTEHFEKLIWLMDEPAAGPGLFSQFMVSKLASQDVKVVLGGQGGDEMFGGYMRYNVAYLEESLKGAILQTSEEGKHIVTLESIIKNLPNLKNYIPMIKQQFSSGMFESMDHRYFNLINRSPNSEKFYTTDFLESSNKEKTFEKFASIFNNTNTESLFNKMTSFDLKTFLPSLLHVEDRVSMGNSIESRVPLLDKHIAQLTASMPPTMKFNGGKNKEIFIKSIQNILPKQIIERKDKMGFPTPINEWLSGPAKIFALDILTDQRTKNRGILNVKNIEKQFNHEGKFSRDLWGALCLETWYRQHID